MNVSLGEKRSAVLAHQGHLLVTGGPGSGKTTIALLKAKQICPGLLAGQEILFLSFSRAAVRQILTRCKTVLTPTERKAIRVQTYHSFCLEVLRSYGSLLFGKPPGIIFPGEERVQKSRYDGDWAIERRRLATEDGILCFDQFAATVAELFERSASLCSLLGNTYPLIIVDEFQDTDDDQWRIVKALKNRTTIFCLADPEQRIF